MGAISHLSRSKFKCIAIALVWFYSWANLSCSQILAEVRSGLIGTTSVEWDLTREQTAKVDPMLSELKKKDDKLTAEIIAIRHQMDKLFMQPSPDRKKILTLQNQIDKKLEDLRLSQWNTAFAVRNMLNPQQRKELGCIKPPKILPGIQLTPAQTESYFKLMRPYLMTSLNSGQKLSELDLEKSFLLQEMDLVHGCHAMKLDMPALMKIQDQINEINSSMGMERLRVAITLHDLLNPEQKRKLMQGQARIRIPDPIGVSLTINTNKSVPPAEKVYPHATLTKQQLAQYNSIMQKEVEVTTAYKRMRKAMLAVRSRMLAAPKLDVAQLESLQSKINKIDAINGMQKLLSVARVRDVLTPEQRHLVFNRHHPKIWKDTGINEQQDKQIMAIHMKIEEADRTGKRKMNTLAADMVHLYYQGGNHDQEILADQNEFNKAQSDMTVAELRCLFDGRSVLTNNQRVKLVELMRDNNRALH